MELVAQELGRLGYCCQTLLQSQSTTAQKQLKATARKRNASGSLVCATKLDPKLNYLVIDDITTTGATLQSARQVLKRAGAKKVACLALVHI